MQTLPRPIGPSEYVYRKARVCCDIARHLQTTLSLGRHADLMLSSAAIVLCPVHVCDLSKEEEGERGGKRGGERPKEGEMVGGGGRLLQRERF
jgi:hypothetical protein